MAIAIHSRILGALTSDAELWFPGLADDLVTHFAQSVDAEWISRAVYGTRRWVANDKGAGRAAIGSISIANQSVIVEALPLADQTSFGDLRFVEDLSAADVDTIKGSFSLLEKELPTLAGTVGSLVRAAHILAATPDYDVSHSHPDVPFSIFVSVPPGDRVDSALRLAESIVHEAMHLQLSLIERVVPLVTGEFVSYSPWKDRQRPTQGVLHGLYVFAVIYQAMGRLNQGNQAQKRAVTQRIHQIQEEIGELKDFDIGLTAIGQEFRRRLVHIVLG